jgi:hypothetical protein
VLGAGGGFDKLAGLLFVALVGAGAVNDDLRAIYRSIDPVPRGQVAGHELEAASSLVSVSTEHPDLAASVAQPLDDEAPEGPGSTGDQDGTMWCGRGSRGHGSSCNPAPVSR